MDDETEAAPMRYVAELVGADSGSERVIRSECVRSGNDREPSAIQTGSAKEFFQEITTGSKAHLKQSSR
jgi:hypothetical protein